MRIQCNRCTINSKIEEYKERLKKMINEEDYNLLDENVINLSNNLNDFISNCAVCDKNNSNKSNKEDSAKVCENLYYYGKSHLFSNLCYYIKQGIINNEVIYISMKEEKYNQLLEEMKVNKLPIKNIKFKDLDDIELRKNEYSFNVLKERVREIFSFNRVKFRGIRWIIEPMAINNVTLQKNILCMDNLLEVYKENTKWNILYIHDSCKCIYSEKILTIS